MASGSEEGKVENRWFNFGSDFLIVVIMRGSILSDVEERCVVIAVACLTRLRPENEGSTFLRNIEKIYGVTS
jgi:hypothetical protein